MPTTSQGLLIANVSSPKVFYSMSATVILNPAVLLFSFFVLLFWVIYVPLAAFDLLRFSFGPNRNPTPNPSEVLYNSLINIISFKIYIALCLIVQWIYVVVTIEQTIQRNPVIHVGPRFPISFGQVCCSFQADSCIY